MFFSLSHGMGFTLIFHESRSKFQFRIGDNAQNDQVLDFNITRQLKKILLTSWRNKIYMSTERVQVKTAPVGENDSGKLDQNGFNNIKYNNEIHNLMNEWINNKSSFYILLLFSFITWTNNSIWLYFSDSYIQLLYLYCLNVQWNLSWQIAIQIIIRSWYFYLTVLRPCFASQTCKLHFF